MQTVKINGKKYVDLDTFNHWRHLAQIGYLILASAICVGLYFSFTSSAKVGNERIARSQQINLFLTKECMRDEARDKILIGALKDAQDRAREALSKYPTENQYQTEKIQNSIDRLSKIDGDCVRSIPPITSVKK